MGLVFYYVYTLWFGGAVLFSFRNAGWRICLFTSFLERLRAVFVFFGAKDEVFPSYISGTQCRRSPTFITINQLLVRFLILLG